VTISRKISLRVLRRANSWLAKKSTGSVSPQGSACRTIPQVDQQIKTEP
jgi:hypothetical protein